MAGFYFKLLNCARCGCPQKDHSLEYGNITLLCQCMRSGCNCRQYVTEEQLAAERRVIEEEELTLP